MRAVRRTPRAGVVRRTRIIWAVGRAWRLRWFKPSLAGNWNPQAACCLRIEITRHGQIVVLLIQPQCIGRSAVPVAVYRSRIVPSLVQPFLQHFDDFGRVLRFDYGCEGYHQP